MCLKHACTLDAANGSSKRVLCMCRDRATVSGEYHFCFDNSFSRITAKTVFFRIIVTEDVTTTGRIDDAAEVEELLPLEITLENFKVLVIGS